VPDLFSSPYFSLHKDPGSMVVRWVRTAVPYPSNEEFVRLHEQAARVLDRMGRARHRLLVDMRRAILNNDPEFEKASAQVRPLLTRDFARVAVLVDTPVGALQVKRHVREDGSPAHVFQSEADAMTFLAMTPADHDSLPPPSSRLTPVSTRNPGSRKPK
jgi:hypothetical protein